jgi:hypothetical protein
MIEKVFIIGIGSLFLGLVLLFFIPKRMGSGQLAYGSYMMRIILPFALIALGIGSIAYSLIV